MSTVVEGYDVRLVLDPPFEIQRMPRMPGMTDAPFALSRWRDTDGARRVENFMAVPGPAQPTDVAIVASAIPTPDGDKMHLLGVGTTGTKVSLGAGIDSFTRFGSLERGPAERAWRVVHRGAVVPWPDGTRLSVSADGTIGALPASGITVVDQ